METTKMLTGQYAVVTGAAGDIGSEIALTLAHAGATIALLDKNKSGLAKVAAQIEEKGGICHCLEVDLKDTAAIQQTVEALFQYHPYWNILINNAATVIRAPLLDLKVEDWDLVQQVNLRAVFILSRLLAREMIANGGGKIINISSNATFYGTPESGAYAASKAGLNQLTKTMAIEWGPHNIQVNVICPGLTNTQLLRNIWQTPENSEKLKKFLNKIPLGRLLEPNEISPLVLFLASEGANYINGGLFQLDNGAKYNPY